MKNHFAYCLEILIAKLIKGAKQEKRYVCIRKGTMLNMPLTKAPFYKNAIKYKAV